MRSGDPAGGVGIAFYGSVGRDGGAMVFRRIEWRMDAFDIDTALLSVSCLSLTPSSTNQKVCFNSMWLDVWHERRGN